MGDRPTVSTRGQRVGVGRGGHVRSLPLTYRHSPNSLPQIDRHARRVPATVYVRPKSRLTVPRPLRLLDMSTG